MMSHSAVREGLYKVSYEGSLGNGYGLAHLANGKIHGGDALICYSGNYTAFANGTVEGKVKGRPYIDGASSDLESLFARDQNTIELFGTVNSDGGMSIDARSKQMPGIALKIQLEFLVE